MLTTAYKGKLPRGWSYPLGAEALSEAFAGVEGASPRALHFSDYRIRDSRFRKGRETDQPYPIVAVKYSDWLSDSEREHAAATGQQDLWSVYVSPVPSDHRAFLRTCLLDHGLALTRKWLDATRVLGARQGRGFCRLVYQEGRQRLVIEQRLNDFDDPSTSEIACVEKKARDNNKMQQPRHG
jgi:hypothetical protein